MPPATPRRPHKPVLWIVAGPNGSGKSSLYNRTDIEGWGGSVWIINPDLLTAKIVEQEQLELTAANLAAVQRVETWLEASIDAYQTIGVETVLSSGKYRRLVTRARDHGFEIRMIYVVLDSAERQLERIRIRVSEGGHDGPVDKVIERRSRSLAQLGWFAGAVDQLYIFDNSIGEPDLIAVKSGDIAKLGKMPADLETALTDAGLKIVDLT